MSTADRRRVGQAPHSDNSAPIDGINDRPGETTATATAITAVTVPPPTTVDPSTVAPSTPAGTVTCVLTRGWKHTFTPPPDWTNAKRFRFSRRSWSSPSSSWLNAGTWYPTNTDPLDIGPFSPGKMIYLKVEARLTTISRGPAIEFEMQIPAEACE